MGYLGATLTQVFTHAHGADVSFIDVTIAQMGNKASKCEWCHAPAARGAFWDFEKVSWVETCPGRRRLTFACSPKPGQWPLWRVPHEIGCRWKSQDRKNVYLSPYFEESLNSKVIKSFVPELRSRYVFFEFRDSYVLCYIYMNIICPFHRWPYLAMVQFGLVLWHINHCRLFNAKSSIYKFILFI